VGSLALIASQGQPIGAAAGSSVVTGLGLSGAAATGVGALVAIPIVLGLGLLAAHDKRVQIAKKENAAVVQAVQAFDADMKTVFNALNSGNITEAQAIQYLQTMETAYWSFIKPYQQAQQIACGTPTPGTGCKTGQVKCDKKACTAGCCVGCDDINGSIANAIYVIQNHGGSFNVCTVFPSLQFENPGRPGYKVDYVAPSLPTTVEGSITNTLSQFVGSLFGGRVSPGHINATGMVEGVSSGGILTASTPVSNTYLILGGGLLFLFVVFLFRK
jgi:hypothetical protein